MCFCARRVLRLTKHGAIVLEASGACQRQSRSNSKCWSSSCKWESGCMDVAHARLFADKAVKLVGQRHPAFKDFKLVIE